MSKWIVAVMAHGGAQNIFNAHLPFWIKPGSDFVVFCPQNDPISTPYHVIARGRSHHETDKMYERLVDIFKWFAASGYTHFEFHEYDSISLDAPLVANNDFRCVPWDSGSPKYLAPKLPHFPMVFSKTHAHKILRAIQSHDGVMCNGVVDRVIADCCYVNRIALQKHEPPGYSQNTIEVKHLPGLESAILNGADMIHGIKDPWTLEMVLRTRDKFLENRRNLALAEKKANQKPRFPIRLSDPRPTKKE